MKTLRFFLASAGPLSVTITNSNRLLTEKIAHMRAQAHTHRARAQSGTPRIHTRRHTQAHTRRPAATCEGYAIRWQGPWLLGIERRRVAYACRQAHTGVPMRVRAQACVCRAHMRARPHGGYLTLSAILLYLENMTPKHRPQCPPQRNAQDAPGEAVRRAGQLVPERPVERARRARMRAVGPPRRWI